MDSKIFTSKNDWFSLTLPNEWEEYDDGVDGTYAFFNAVTWTGNLRITPLSWSLPTDSDEDQASKYISEEVEKNEGAIKLQLGIYPCAFYKEDLVEEKDAFVIYYFILGKINTLLTCSFTIDKKQENTQENEVVLKTVQDIIKSIIIH